MINERDINELRPGDRITIDVWFGGMGVDEYGDSCYLFSGTPGYAPCAHVRDDRFQSCNPRFTDQFPDNGKLIDHIVGSDDMVKPLEFEGVRIAKEKRAEDRFVVETWQMWFAHTLAADSSHEALCVILGLPKFLKENGIDIGKLFAEVD